MKGEDRHFWRGAEKAMLYPVQGSAHVLSAGIGLQVFLDPCCSLLMTFLRSHKKPLFIWRQLDFGRLGTGSVRGKSSAYGDGDFCAPRWVVDTIAEKQTVERQQFSLSSPEVDRCWQISF